MTEEETLRCLWQAVLSRPLHATSCGCTMPGPMHIGPDDIERDLMDYLEDKHRLSGSPAWVSALRDREAERSFPFVAWFQTLSTRPDLRHLPWEPMRADIIGTLCGMAEHARGRLVPATARAPGWLLPDGPV